MQHIKYDQTTLAVKTGEIVVQPGDSRELSYTFKEPGTLQVGCHQPRALRGWHEDRRHRRVDEHPHQRGLSALTGLSLMSDPPSRRMTPRQSPPDTP